MGPNSAAHGSLLTGHRSLSGETGFTLIEVIAALIIISVLAAMIFPVTSGGMWRTAKGVGECRAFFELQGQMEEIVVDYKSDLSDDGDVDLEDLLATVINDYSSADSDNTKFLDDSEGDLELTDDPTPLLLVTLANGNQRLATIFSSKQP